MKLDCSTKHHHNAHLGNACRERRSHFAVYFTAGFSNKTVPCTMNELYLTGATREADLQKVATGGHG